MKAFIFVLLFINIFLFIYVSPSRNNRWRRQARIQCQSNCIVLRECDILLGKLRDAPRHALKEIRRRICGRQNQSVKVCCPQKRVEVTKIPQYFPSNCGNNPRVANKIILGENASMGEFPWVAALGYKSTVKDAALQFLASGTLINARYVLTSAHVLDSRRLGDFQLKLVRLGEWDMANENDCFHSQFGKKCAPPTVDIKPEKMVMHPLFEDEVTLSNDIALIRMEKTVEFTSYIMPICLPSFGIHTEFLIKNRTLVVIGWGVTESNTGSNILLKVTVPLANQSLCSRFHYNLFGDKQLCVGGTRKDSCSMDSGGPLMVPSPNGPPFLQVGIVSFGPYICGTPGIPSVYTSVSSYKDWIKENMKPW